MTEAVREATTRSLVLAPDLEEVARARNFVAGVAREAGFSEDRVFDIMVACSEAVANAIEHVPVRGQVEVTALLHPDSMEVQVEGPGEFQTPDRLKERSNRGLGLPLMAKLANHLALYSGTRGGTLITLSFYRTAVPVGKGQGYLPPSLQDVIRENELISAITDNAPVGICVLDTELRYIWANPAYQSSLDEPYRSMDLTGLFIGEAVIEAKNTRLLDDLRTVSRTGRRSINKEYEFKGQGSRTPTWWRRTAVPLTAKSEGPPYDLLLVVTEETKRKKVEKALKESQERLSLALSAGRLAAWDWRADQGRTIWNEEHFCMMGYQPSEVTPSFEAFVERIHPKDRARVRAALSRAVRKGGEYTSEFRARWPDGTIRWVESHGVMERDAEGRASRCYGVMVDVTKRKEVEAALRRSEEEYRALAEQNECLYRQQLDIAESLQLALLSVPSEIGDVRVGHLYRSATETARVGGDFYDVFEVKEGKIALFIGDVAGHGIQATRTATLVKNVVRVFTHQSLRTREVLKRTNTLLIEEDLPGFVSLFLGILDAATGRLRYSSAGHPDTLLRRTSGEIQTLGKGSSPLGVFREATWRGGEVDLRSGDLLLLYTDGVVEARREGEFFGEKRLQRLLQRKRISVQRLPTLILDQVLSFSGGQLCDDVAILALSPTQVPAAGHSQETYRQERLLD